MQPATPPAKRQTPAKRSTLRPFAIAAGAILFVLLVAAGYYLVQRPAEPEDSDAPGWIPALPSPAVPAAAPTETAATEAPAAGIAAALQALSREAAAADAPGAEALAATATRAAALDPATQQAALDRLARTTSLALAAALELEAGLRTGRVARLAPWADRRQSAPGASARQRTMANSLHTARSAVATSAARTRAATDPAQAIAAARGALGAYEAFERVYARAYTMARAAPAAPLPSAPPAPAPAPTVAALPISRADLAARISEFKQVHSSAKALAGQVATLARASKPRRSDGEAAQAAYRVRQDNAARARHYANHLDALSRSLRGAKTDQAAESIVAQARMVRGYLVTLQARSAAALPPRR